MEDGFNNIDDLLRSSLGNFQKQPSPKVWMGISRSLFYSGLGKIILLISGIVVLSVAAYLYWDYTHVESDAASYVKVDENNVRDDNNLPVTNEPAYKDEKRNVEKGQETAIVAKGLTENKETVMNDILEENPGINLGSGEEETSDVGFNALDNKGNADIVDIPIVASVPVVTSHAEKSYLPQSTYPGLPRLSDANSVERMELKAPYVNYAVLQSYSTDFVHERNLFGGMPVVPGFDYGRANRVSFGLYVSPEVIFMNDEENTRKLQLNFDGVINFKPNEDFYLQGGLGIGVSQDDGTYNIDYEQYDSVGYYYEVNSFTIDPATGKPVFKTSVENVYDTVGYNELSLTGNRYTYFRMSGFMGYRVHYAKNFSVFIKGGLTYSVLVSSHEPNPEFKNENAINLKITNETAKRIHDTWQVSAGVGLNYRLSNNLTLTGEPVFNYYLRPVYERRLSVKNPYSLGLKMGLLFKF
jgi:hypothetical protein